MDYPRILLAGTHSAAGKTTLTIGLTLALKKRGLDVQPFKAGPDYIDPSYHTLISSRICRNLDTWMLSEDTILELFQRQAQSSDISIIEGVMGLYDGLRDKENGSSAHLAKMLKSPVILIVDAGSMSRSAAAVVLGYKEFDRDVELKGIILNNIGSPAHYCNAKKSIENHTGLSVLGFLPRDKNLSLPERHLGLIPADEKAPLDSFKKKLLNLVEKNINVDKIINISRKAEEFPCFSGLAGRAHCAGCGTNRISIAVAFDQSFNFYYQDNLDILESFGGRLIKFSPLVDNKLPKDIRGLYIGGGFPELFGRELSANAGLRDDIYKRAKEGMPIYAECAGLMYLTEKIINFAKNKFPMVGIFKGTVNMGNRLQALGYVNIEVMNDNILSKKGSKLRGHMFHWSYFEDEVRKENFAYRVIPAFSKPLRHRESKLRGLGLDGLVKWNVLASYTHLHFASNTGLAKNFIEKCKEWPRPFFYDS